MLLFLNSCYFSDLLACFNHLTPLLTLAAFSLCPHVAVLPKSSSTHIYVLLLFKLSLKSSCFQQDTSQPWCVHLQPSSWPFTIAQICIPVFLDQSPSPLVLCVFSVYTHLLSSRYYIFYYLFDTHSSYNIKSVTYEYRDNYLYMLLMYSTFLRECLRFQKSEL